MVSEKEKVGERMKEKRYTLRASSSTWWGKELELEERKVYMIRVNTAQHRGILRVSQRFYASHHWMTESDRENTH